MTHEQLVRTAEALPIPSASALEAYQGRQASLAEGVTAALLARPDVLRLIGEGNEQMMRDNHRNHARFIASLGAGLDPEVLVDSVLWVFRAYTAHGFGLTYWSAQLNAWLDGMDRELPPDAVAELRPLYGWMLVHQPAFVQLAAE